MIEFPKEVEAPRGATASSRRKTERPKNEIIVIVVEYIIFYNIIVDEGVNLSKIVFAWEVSLKMAKDFHFERPSHVFDWPAKSSPLLL